MSQDGIQLLTDEERRKFVSYLYSCVFSSQQLVAQMEKLGGMNPLISKYRAEILAMKVVIKMLDEVEEIVVRGNDGGKMAT